MSHNVQNFTLHAGDKRVLEISVYNEDPADPGQPDLTSPIDLSAATLRWALASHATDAATLVTKTSAGGGGITVGGDGNEVMQVQLDKADTVDLSGKYFHEAEVVEAAGDDYTVATGTVTIAPTVLD